MSETIKNFIKNGVSTVKGLLKLEWLNFKNWKGWTSLRALYLAFVVVCAFHTCLYGSIYFAACAFFRVEPVLWALNKLGFSETKI